MSILFLGKLAAKNICQPQKKKTLPDITRDLRQISDGCIDKSVQIHWRRRSFP